MTNPKNKMSVTAVLHQDSGRITAFFNELPGLVVQGHSNNDVKTKLSSLLDSYIKRLDSMKHNMDIQTTSLV